ncbi:MAG: hypothetical protein KDA90_15980 [Planctomycetaceae bacterium]|nr:hypothetical protein [Planctomycetaceae bacterium]
MKMFLAVAAVACLGSMSLAAEGLETGSNVGAFYVKDVTGPAAGEKLCYRCRYGGRPVVSIFTRKVDDNVASLIKQVDGTVGQNAEKKMAAFVVVLTDNPEGQEGALKSVATSKGIQNTPLTTFDGEAGPPSYKIAQDSEVTVMMWVNGKLQVNEALKASELTSEKVSALVNSTNKILN